MGKSKAKARAYDSDDYDDDSDDGYMAGAKLKTNEGNQPNRVNGNTYSLFPPPTKLWTYDYIVGPFKDKLVFSGVGDKRAKSLLAEDRLIHGSENGGIATRWSDGHEFWEATIASTGQQGLFFSGESVDELCTMLSEQCEQVARATIRPDPEKSIRVKDIIEPGSLKPFRPDTAAELRELIESFQGRLFSLLLTQSRHAYNTICSQGGAALAIKTQRYEADKKVVLEIGWSSLQFVKGKNGMEEKEDVYHGILEDSQNLKNGLTLPDNQKHFGFGKTVTKREEEIICDFASTITNLTSTGPLLLIFHEAAAETDYFSKEMDITPWLTNIPSSKLYSKSLSASEAKKKNIQPHYPVIIQDTQRLYAAYVAQPQAAQVSLSRACKDSNIPVNRMNNAGNDAYYILQLYDLLMNNPGGPAR